MPPKPRACPGTTVMSVVPRAAMRWFTESWAPRPSATIAITAETPITIPSMVRKARSRLAPSASRATRSVSPKSMAQFPPPRRAPPAGALVVPVMPPPVRSRTRVAVSARWRWISSTLNSATCSPSWSPASTSA